MVVSRRSNSRVITANFLDVLTYRIFTVVTFRGGDFLSDISGRRKRG